MSRTRPSNSFKEYFVNYGWTLDPRDYSSNRYAHMTPKQADRWFMLRASRWNCWSSDRFYWKTYGIGPKRSEVRRFLSTVCLETDETWDMREPTYESRKY